LCVAVRCERLHGRRSSIIVYSRPSPLRNNPEYNGIESGRTRVDRVGRRRAFR
jgi:hypothetical protein